MSIILLQESKEEDGERRSEPRGIEVELRALEHDNIEFRSDGEAILA